MLELNTIFELFRNNNNDYETYDMEVLNCFRKVFTEYEYIFRDCEKNGRWNDKRSGGFDCYERINNNFKFDAPNKNVVLKNDEDYAKFNGFLRGGMEEYNKRIVAELTKTYQTEKQAENYKRFHLARQKKSTFQCEICEPSCYTNSTSVWEAHITTAQHIKNTDGDPRLYTCDACGEEFENTKLRNRHVDALKCFQSRTCKDCNSTLSSKQRFVDHYINGICNVMIKKYITFGNLSELQNLKPKNI